MACKWINICPLRKFERQGRLNEKWEKRYCETKNNWKNCRRYQLEEEGTEHPDNMLPDGEIDKSLK